MRQKDFLAICAVGSREEVELAIKRGADVNKKAYIYGAKVPPLFVAVMEENEGAIEVLLEHGAHSGEGFMAAIVKGKKKLLKLLVNLGADVNQKDAGVNGENPLCLAVIANKPKVVKWLIEFGADVNVKSGAGYTPLLYTVIAQMGEFNNGKIKKIHPDIIASLMKAGANYDEPMILAVKAGNIPFLDIIFKNGADINRKCWIEGERTALMSALFSGDKPIDAEMVRFLAENGADVDAVFGLGSDAEVITNAINISITAERPDITEILLENGADPNFCDMTGRTSLVYAVVTDEKIVRLLLEYGADPNIPDNNKRTPLMLAAIDVGIELEIIEALIEYGADVNAQDKDGMTALMWAVGSRDREAEYMISSLIRTGGFVAEGWESWFGLTAIFGAFNREARLDTVRLLLKHGADVSIADKKGMNAIACARMNYDDEMVEILREEVKL